ncbi:MAG TPA: LLM class flavin-dependent oxidoreductase [Actinomycetota bacterium]|nr:LLM class flavin-dependent oxidoreductase [Actinomycetota bacterium]
MKKGIVLPQHEVDPSEVLEAAKLAEEAGLDSVWLIDHLHGRPDPKRPILELGAMLPAVAQATRRVSVGPLILRIGLRLPAVAAAMVRTVDMVAAGRLIVALGLSDANNADEQQSYGLPLEPRERRLETMRETITSIRQAVPDTPIWIGGAGNDLVEMVRTVEGWNFWGKVVDMEGPLERLRSSGFGGVVSWAGPPPGKEGWDSLRAMGVDHVIVATGKDNYRERITKLASRL